MLLLRWCSVRAYIIITNLQVSIECVAVLTRKMPFACQLLEFVGAFKFGLFVSVRRHNKHSDSAPIHRLRLHFWRRLSRASTRRSQIRISCRQEILSRCERVRRWQSTRSSKLRWLEYNRVLGGRLSTAMLLQASRRRRCQACRRKNRHAEQ
jgi:hypothetical protein